jgi:hypothetical protein
MGLTIQGYVLEPPRISTSNNPFTASPNVAVGTSAADQAAYAAAYPSGSEPNSRVEYLVLALPDGSASSGIFLRDARFGWTKNEGTLTASFQRFDFDSSSQSFKPLPGSAPVQIGVIGPTLNATRLRVTPPVTPLPAAPFRLAYGAGSGTTLTVNVVTAFSDPNTLPATTVELLKAGGANDGDLNWSTTLISNPANEGLAVTWQRQQFYSFTESTGRLGPVPTAAYPGYLLSLSPLPATGQSPLVRLGAGIWLTPVEYATEVALGAAADPVAGTFYWAADTGRLRFNPADATAYGGSSVYYDGVLLARDVMLPRWAIGTVDVPAVIPTLPSAGADLIFYLPALGKQFASVTRYDPAFTLAFPAGPGSAGVVEVLPAVPPGVSAQVRFSTFDQAAYAGQAVEFIQGDLPIERGVYLRLFRTVVNPDATGTTPDVTLFYTSEEATLASPITGMPMVFLPSVPVDSPLFPTTLKVTQGTGSYLSSNFPDLAVPSPSAGLGYFLDLDADQLRFANRKNAQTKTLLTDAGGTSLDDALLLGTNYSFELEVAPGTGLYAPLTLGQDAILDPTPGVLTFAATAGVVQKTGMGAFSGAIFSDPSLPVLTTLAGDLLVVSSGAAQGVYKLAAGNLAAGVSVDVPTANLPWGAGLLTDVPYEVRRGQEVVADAYWEPLALIDPVTKVEKIRAVGTMQNATTIVASSTATYVNETTLSTTIDLVAAGVVVGDTLEMLTGPETGTFRTITVVDPYEMQVATPFVALPLPPLPLTDDYRIVRRLRVPVVTAQSVVSGASGTFPTTTTVLSTTDFLAAGVRVGDTFKLTSGPDAGTSRAITGVTATTLTVVTAWASQLGPQTFDVIRTNARFRFGQTTFSKTTAIVASDANFTTPASLASGTVEICQATGNLNFSAADLAATQVYWVHRLTQGVDYQVQPLLAFIQFTERFLQGEEALVTYVPLDANGDPLPVTEERARFLIRKELTQPTPRPAVTSVVKFNTAGRTVAATPAPAVFRGGRPQTSAQCLVNTVTSTVTFLPDVGYMTDALPSGSTVQTDERIYVDYNVFEAVGGEQNVTLLNNMQVAQVTLTQDATSFDVLGDQTLTFPIGYLIKVERDYVYRIASATYAPATNTTTVALAPGEKFAEDLANPKLFRASTDTPLAASTYARSFFVAEAAPYQVIARGMNRFRVYGDRTAAYRTGCVVYLASNPILPGYYQDFYLVSGSTLVDGWTEVTIQANAVRQYAQGQAYLRYSSRPILQPDARQAVTTRTPILTAPGADGLPVDLPLGVYRKVAGKVGEVLVSPTDYTLDAAGVLKYSASLVPGEEVGLFYTGNRTVRAGVRLRFSYTHAVVPNDANGLVGQNLVADYTTFSPDSFYFRVETLTNFKGEVQDYLTQQAKGNVPSSGPRTSNAATPRLYEQGRESVYFPEGHIANQDIVARAMLKYLNDNVHHLEDTLQSFDGRLVGAGSGRFRFDGNTNNPIRTSYSQVTNEIDDTFKVSESPYTFTFVPPATFTFTSVGTYQKLYEAGERSRVYPMRKGNLRGVTTAGQDTSAAEGDVVLDFGQAGIMSPGGRAYRRLPMALVLKDVQVGDTLIEVDNAQGSADYFRPNWGLATPAPALVYDPTGVLIVGPGAPLTVQTALGAPERLQLAAGSPLLIPRGSTIFLCTTGALKDTTYQQSYRIDGDVGIDLESGRLTYLEPYWPFDGSFSPPLPVEWNITPPNSKEYLQMDDVGIWNRLTAPYRFPALDGKAEDDAGDIGLPIRSRTFDCETTYLADESNALPSILSATTAAVQITNVTMGGPFTTLVHTGPWPGPAIQQYDLVRFTTGPNASAGFRRVATVGANTLVVDGPFPFAATSDSVLITAGGNVTSGIGAVIDLAGTQVTSAALAPAQQGQTIIFTSGANAGVRRQIVSKPAPNIALLDFPVPTPAVVADFRVSNHLATYNQFMPVSLATQKIVEVVSTNDHPPAPRVDSEVNGVERFFDGDVVTGTEGVLTDVVALQIGVVNGDTLTGTTNFVTAGVNASHAVYIQAGANAGFYQVTSVTGPTTLKVDPSFPVAGGVTYRVVRAFAVGFAGLTDLFSVLAGSKAWAASTVAWQGLFMGTVPVYPLGVLDPLVYANGLLTTDVTTRQGAVAARLAAIGNASGPVVKVETVLGDRDKLYDKRYVWLDGRVNVEKGFVYMQARAVSTRVANLEKQVNDLIKLLSLEAL